MDARGVIHICPSLLILVHGIFKKIQKLSADHLPQHRLGNRIRLTVVVDVHVHAIHHIEMRVSKQLFHRCVFDLGCDLARHELGEVGVFSEALHIGQGW